MEEVRTIELLDRIKGKRILVVGDVILDRYVVGEVTRISREAPVPVLQKTEERDICGGASNVAMNIKSLGGEPFLVGLLGEDPEGEILKALLYKSGVEFRLITECDRPTTLKVRFTHKNQQFLRVDRELRKPVGRVAAQKVIETVRAEAGDFDCAVFSDYALGIFTPDLASELVSHFRRIGVPLVVDPKPSNDYLCGQCDVFLPGKDDAAVMVGILSTEPLDGSVVASAAAERFGNPVIVTDGPKGMYVAEPGCQVVHVKSTAREVYDVSGAGDTVTASVALALASGSTLLDAACFANEAAGVAVSKFGTAVVFPDEIRKSIGGQEKIVSRAKLEEIIEEVKKENKTVVFTNGCFDLLHVGHIRYLKASKNFGDILIVAINSDSSVRRLKGPQRPLISEKQRAELIAALEFVDYVTIFDEDSPVELISILKPHIFTKGGDYTEKSLPEAPIVRSYGGNVVIVPLFENGISTTGIIGRISRERND